MEFTDGAQDQKFRIDPKLRQGFKLDEAVVLPNDGEVICLGQRRHLPTKAMEILLYLTQNHDQLISSEQLLQVGWGDATSRRSSLTNVISEIRYALDDHKECPEYIQTLPRKGYRLIAKVELLDDKVLYPNVWPLKAASQHSLEEPNKGDKQWHLSLALLNNSKLFRVSAAFIISTWVLLQVLELLFPIFNIPSWGLKIAVLILVIGFPLALLYTWLKEIKIKKLLWVENKNGKGRKNFFKQLAFDFGFVGLLSIGMGFLAMYLIESIELEQSIPEIANSVISIDQPVRDNLIAVLPFSFEQAASLPSYFKATFQAELIDALSQQADFNLVSQRAVNELEAKSSMSDYVNRLGSRYLLDGQVVDGQQDFSVLLSLTDTKTSLQVWSTTIQGSASKLLVAQKELYRQSFNALALLAQHQPSDNYKIISTSDFKAYDSYIQGKDQLYNATDEQDISLAERHFLNSLNYDPKFTLASAGLCQTYLDQYEMTRQLSAFKSAQQRCSALLADTQLKEEALVSLGNLNRISGEHTKAITFYQKAIYLNPNNLDAITGTARSNDQLGNFEQAKELLLETIKIEPGYWKNYLELGDLLIGNGKYKSASEQYARVTLLKPNNDQGFNRLGAAFYLDDQIEPASIAWQRSIDIRPSGSIYSNLGTALFLRHQFDKARETYRLALDIKSSDPVLWANLGDAQKFDSHPNLAKISYRKAIELTQEQLIVNPHDQIVLGMRARYQSELGLCAKASSASQSLQQQKIADPYLYYDLSIVAINCQQLSLAQNLIGNAIKLGYSEKLIARDIQFQHILEDLKISDN